MKLSGVHILLTYQCTFECDHCFVWGSPRQSGTLTLGQIANILEQAKEAGAEWIYFEGGEPFLYYAVMLRGVQMAAGMGFKVGIVTNAYWANSLEDALEWLKPFAGLIGDLSVSSDLYHYSEQMSAQARYAVAAAEQLGLAAGVISVCQPETAEAAQTSGTVTGDAAAVMYRGRAVSKLAAQAVHHPWETFTTCPHEDLRDPGRAHLDPLGNLHICQGIVIGNLFERPLAEICAGYDPDVNPITGPLLAGGPAELVREFALPHEAAYADACHLCDSARRLLRGRFPEVLKPDQMYGGG